MIRRLPNPPHARRTLESVLRSLLSCDKIYGRSFLNAITETQIHSSLLYELNHKNHAASKQRPTVNIRSRIGRRSNLTPIARRKIEALLKINVSCVNDYTSRQKLNMTQKPRDRPSNFSTRAHRAVVKTARQGKMTASKVFREMQLSVTVRHIQRFLDANEHLSFRTLKVRPHLKFELVRVRKKSSEFYGFCEFKEWKGVLFSDEKRSSLCSPDGLTHFWGDHRLSRDIFSKGKPGWGGFMVWAVISWEGKTNLVVVKCNHDAMGT